MDDSVDDIPEVEPPKRPAPRKLLAASSKEDRAASGIVRLKNHLSTLSQDELIHAVMIYAAKSSSQATLHSCHFEFKSFMKKALSANRLKQRKRKRDDTEEANEPVQPSQKRAKTPVKIAPTAAVDAKTLAEEKENDLQYQEECERVRSMSVEELLAYVDDGLKKKGILAKEVSDEKEDRDGDEIVAAGSAVVHAT